MDTSDQNPELPPPFVVGRTYFDRDGEYKVLSVAGDDLTIEHADGRRMSANATIRARIHRGVIEDRLLGVPKRGRPTISLKRDRMIFEILRFEVDGLDHTGLEIDQHLRENARDFGYSDRDIAETHIQRNRGVFAIDGDWAKADMTGSRMHAVVGDHSYVDTSGQRRSCKIYRITATGLE